MAAEPGEWVVPGCFDVIERGLDGSVKTNLSPDVPKEVFRLNRVDPAVAVVAHWSDSDFAFNVFLRRSLCVFPEDPERMLPCLEEASRALSRSPLVEGLRPLPVAGEGSVPVVVTSEKVPYFGGVEERPPRFALTLGWDSDAGCLTVNGLSMLWPPGTWVSAVPVVATLPDGATAVPGDRLVAAGGYTSVNYLAPGSHIYQLLSLEGASTSLSVARANAAGCSSSTRTSRSR
ncbi:MAG: hypothetical protein OXG37_05780 [Actinomycetia bacterium]|nr:hypothetical protein [Actinomycetes bacterium]